MYQYNIYFILREGVLKLRDGQSISTHMEIVGDLITITEGITLYGGKHG